MVGTRTRALAYCGGCCTPTRGYYDIQRQFAVMYRATGAHFCERAKVPRIISDITFFDI
jgi:hypothetical protein